MSIEFEPIAPTYLGDGVYASFDGYHVWLGLGHHEAKTIALEPPVIEKLINYIDHINIKVREHHAALLAAGPDGDAGELPN